MGQWQARGGAAALAAFADLPADADHDDVDRPPHLGRVATRSASSCSPGGWSAIASGPEAICRRSSHFFAGIPGRLLLFLFSWALIHHMLGGIRHLIWDTGRGLDKVSIEIFAWATIIGSTALTILIWVAGYWLRGA